MIHPVLPELRRRTTWLIQNVDGPTRAFVRLVPLLLNARFRRPALDSEPPCTLLQPRRRRWGRLCEVLGLPPPTAFGTHRALVRSVILSPLPDGKLGLWIVPVETLGPADAKRLDQRLDAMRELAHRHCPRLAIDVLGHQEVSASLIPWMAICAGEIAQLSDRSIDPLDAVTLAPSSLARCLTLLVDSHAPSPLEVLKRRSTWRTRPEEFAARWSGRSVAWTSIDAAFHAESLVSLQKASTTLWTACIAALRDLPVQIRKKVRPHLRSDLFFSHLLPAFRARFEHLIQDQPRSLDELHRGWGLSIDGILVARASTIDQLQARAICESPLLANPSDEWKSLGEAVKRGQAKSIVVVSELSKKHLVISSTPNRRPRSRRVDNNGLFRFVLLERAKKQPIEVMAHDSDHQAFVARVHQLASISLPSETPVGVQVYDRLILVHENRCHVYGLIQAMARPRKMIFIPEQAELMRSLRKPMASPLASVHATVWPEVAGRASVVYQDSGGTLFRESFQTAELESRLIEARELLRVGTPLAALSVTVHPSLAGLSGRRSSADVPVVDVEVECTWPSRLRVWIDDEAFGGEGDLPYSALCEALMSRWPPGTWGRVGISRIQLKVPAAYRSPLLILAVRSRLLRRVNVGLRRVARLLMAA